MDLSVFRRIARELRQFGVERLGLFYMNEPFTDERLPKAIRIAKNDCELPYVFLTSNGLEASAERLRACFEAGLDSLKFALNFSGPNQLPASGSHPLDAYQEILKNVGAARRVRDEVWRETGRYCRLSASSLAYDSEQVERMQPLIEAILGSVDEHYWLPYLGRADLAPAGTSPETGGSANGFLCKAIPCWTLFTEAHITADAELSACCLDSSARFAMGNLMQMSFAEAWHGPRFRKLRQAHLSEDISGSPCEHCIGSD